MENDCFNLDVNFNTLNLIYNIIRFLMVLYLCVKSDIVCAAVLSKHNSFFPRTILLSFVIENKSRYCVRSG